MLAKVTVVGCSPADAPAAARRGYRVGLRCGRGVGAFNVIGIEHAEAMVTGAETAGPPVVLQISKDCAAYGWCVESIACA